MTLSDLWSHSRPASRFCELDLVADVDVARPDDRLALLQLLQVREEGGV